MKFQMLAAVFGSALLIGSSSARADQLGVNFTDVPSADATGSLWTLGYEFQVTTPVTLDGLATFDPSGALTQDVQVGLWADNGTLIDLATVAAGSLAGPDGPFAEVSVTPILLTPGYYDVGSYDPSDSWSGGESGVTVDPAITFVQSRYSSQGTNFSYPNNNDEPDSVYAWFGGNVVLGGTAVPDASSSLILLSVACLTLSALRRKLA